MKQLAYIACLVGFLAACTEPREAAPQVPVEVKTTSPKPGKFLSVTSFSGPDAYSVRLRADTSGVEAERAARELCDGKDFCKVLGWFDEDLMPRGFPMTDREMEGQVFAYSLNRQTGLDEAMWLCEPGPACPS